mmetsp:Transcript_11369/g.17168  ORF Transcript_11369/g.17168 Transcript_11369/m.17168 type:complete len:86 (+) Transcript_11369:264-521(+)
MANRMHLANSKIRVEIHRMLQRINEMNYSDDEKDNMCLNERPPLEEEKSELSSLNDKQSSNSYMRDNSNMILVREHETEGMIVEI